MSYNTTQIYIETPIVACDICHRASFIHPGIWSETSDIPPALNLQRTPGGLGPYPTFRVVGCATEQETEEAAIANGWQMVKLRASIKIVCPKCQALISELAGHVGLWEREK